jgi:hypothetical protein
LVLLLLLQFIERLLRSFLLLLHLLWYNRLLGLLLLLLLFSLLLLLLLLLPLYICLIVQSRLSGGCGGVDARGADLGCVVAAVSGVCHEVPLVCIGVGNSLREE